MKYHKLSYCSTPTPTPHFILNFQISAPFKFYILRQKRNTFAKNNFLKVFKYRNIAKILRNLYITQKDVYILHF